VGFARFIDKLYQLFHISLSDFLRDKLLYQPGRGLTKDIVERVVRLISIEENFRSVKFSALFFPLVKVLPAENEIR